MARFAKKICISPSETYQDFLAMDAIISASSYASNVPIYYGTQMLKIVYEYLFFKFRITYIYIWLSLSNKSNCKKKFLMHSIYDPWSSYEVFFSVLLRINVIRLHETFMQLWLKILSKAALQNLVHLGTFFLAKVRRFYVLMRYTLYYESEPRNAWLKICASRSQNM